MTTIGVCIPTYDRPQELARLLESLPATVRAFVSDNGDLLDQAYRDRYPTVRFQGTGGTVLSMFANWNRAARLADTDWLLVPSDDDIYHPGAFDVIAAAIAANPGAGVIVFGHDIVGDAYEVLSTWRPQAGTAPAPTGFERFKYGVQARMPSVAFRRTAIEALGFFDEGFACTASDSDLVQRALLSFDAAFVPDVVAGYRVWARSATTATLATQRWLADVDYWGTKIEKLMRGIPAYAAQARHVRDELYATNLLAGLRLLRSRGAARECRPHFRASRYPWAARWTTQLRILAQLARASVA